MYYTCVFVRTTIAHIDAPSLLVPQPHAFRSYSLPNLHNMIKITRLTCSKIIMKMPKAKIPMRNFSLRTNPLVFFRKTFKS